MKINYNVTGAKRKELVQVISEATGTKAEYKFMPTCNYEIGRFTVTKNGIMEFDDTVDSEQFEKVLADVSAAGFVPEPQETEDKEESAETDKTAPQSEETGLMLNFPLIRLRSEP